MVFYSVRTQMIMYVGLLQLPFTFYVNDLHLASFETRHASSSTPLLSNPRCNNRAVDIFYTEFN